MTRLATDLICCGHRICGNNARVKRILPFPLSTKEDRNSRGYCFGCYSHSRESMGVCGDGARQEKYSSIKEHHAGFWFERDC